MQDKTIKLKLVLTQISGYIGGAEALLNDIKNAGVILHKDAGFSITSKSDGKYNASSDVVEKLNELKHLVIYDVSDNEIARLKIEFLEIDDSVYAIPDGATIEDTELNIGFIEIKTYTILFTNLNHPEFDIELPESITVNEGESVVLPSLSGEYDDEEFIYTPESWNIGAFGESVTPTSDMTANLVWKAEEIKPALPNVSQTNDFGDYNWFKFNISGSNYTFGVGVTTSIYLIDSTAYGVYDDSKSYAVIFCKNYANDIVTRIGVEVVNHSGNIWVHNRTGDTLVVSHTRIAVCSSNKATVVTVYDSNNTTYNAFKYSINGTDYYYVLDETQNDWVTDLSSIGYSLTITLPTITHMGNASVSKPPSNTSMVANEILGLYLNESRIPYDDTKVYAISKVTASNSVVLTRMGFIARKGSSTTYGYTDCVETVNKTGVTQSSVYYLDLYSASLTDVVTAIVYDSNNIEYNSFKYTLDGTDYYYVLDDLQDNWATDLSSIGYSLTKSLPNVSTGGDFGTDNLLHCSSSVSSGSFLYIQANSTIQPYISGTSNRPFYDSNKTYATVYALDDDDNRLDAVNIVYVDDGSSNLLVKNLGSSIILWNSSKVAVCSSNTV